MYTEKTEPLLEAEDVLIEDVLGDEEQPKILKTRKVNLEPNDPDISMCGCRCISYCSCDCDRGGIIS